MKSTILAGSYERYLWIFDFKTLKPIPPQSPHENAGTPTPTPEKRHSLVPLFSQAAHDAPVNCAAACGPIAATGGGDDTLKIFDLSALEEIGSLFHPNGHATALGFFSSPISTSGGSFPQNLFTGTREGYVNIYDCDPPFVYLKSVHAHRNSAVNSLAVHPTGRLALTVGRDSRLAMINLMLGRRCFGCKLPKEGDVIEYDKGGGKFFVVAGDTLSVHDGEDARVVSSMVHPTRDVCLAQSRAGLLYTGGEDRKLRAWDPVSGTMCHCIEDAHTSRIKGLAVLGSKAESDTIVASASSNGVIRTWDMRMTAKEKTKPLAEANSKARITCFAASHMKKT